MFVYNSFRNAMRRLCSQFGLYKRYHLVVVDEPDLTHLLLWGCLWQTQVYWHRQDCRCTGNPVKMVVRICLGSVAEKTKTEQIPSCLTKFLSFCSMVFHDFPISSYPRSESYCDDSFCEMQWPESHEVDTQFYINLCILMLSQTDCDERLQSSCHSPWIHHSILFRLTFPKVYVFNDPPPPSVQVSGA